MSIVTMKAYIDGFTIEELHTCNRSSIKVSLGRVIRPQPQSPRWLTLFRILNLPASVLAFPALGWGRRCRDGTKKPTSSFLRDEKSWAGLGTSTSTLVSPPRERAP